VQTPQTPSTKPGVVVTDDRAGLTAQLLADLLDVLVVPKLVALACQGAPEAPRHRGEGHHTGAPFTGPLRAATDPPRTLLDDGRTKDAAS
jgi:hypothetical protein